MKKTLADHKREWLADEPTITIREAVRIVKGINAQGNQYSSDDQIYGIYKCGYDEAKSDIIKKLKERK